MKSCPILMFVFLFLLSCQSTNQGDPTSDTSGESVAVSAQNSGLSAEEKMAQTDAEIERIQAASKSTTNNTSKLEKVVTKKYSEKDAITVLQNDGKLFRIVELNYPPDEQVQTFFYLLDGSLAMYKQREWLKTAQPSARETTCYIDQNGIYKRIERRVELEPGQNPSGVITADPIEIKMNQDSLYRVILADFQQVQKDIAKNK